MNKEHTRIDLVEGGNVFKQGDHATLGFIPRDYAGNIVDLTGKLIDVSILGRKGIMFTSTATFDSAAQVIRILIDEVLDYGDHRIEFTVTDPNDADYRRKFPSGEYDGRIKITPGADNMDFVGVAMTTVTQLRNEQEAAQASYEQIVDVKITGIESTVTDLESTVEAGIGAFTQDSEVVLARGVEANLGARLDNVNQQLADKVTRGKIVGNDFDISSDTGKLKLTNLADEVRQAIAGTASINATIANNAGTTEKIAPRAVNKSKLNFSAITGIPSKNLFDKNAVYKGYFVRYQDGTLSANTSYSGSDYIAVKPNTTYTANAYDQLAFKDVNYNFISGLGLNTYTSFTTPANAAYIQVSVPNSRLEDYQLEEGSASTKYVSANPTLSENNLEKFTKEKIDKPDHILRVMNQLENPFIKTKIKLLGDSITAGVGGTGWSATGNTIPGTTYNESLTSSVSWANMLNSHINTLYNKEHYISPNNPAIEITRIGTNSAYVEYFNLCFLQYRFRFYNFTATNLGVKLSFYGDHADVLYMKKTSTGKFKVLVDGVLYGEVDTYDTSTSYSNVYKVTGLSMGEHVIEVVETGAKNASSSGLDVYIEGFKIPKKASVKNYGISGRDSQYYNVNKQQLIEADDDIIIMQLGTNDRKNNSPDVTKTHQREIIKYAQSLGIDVILLCANPVVVSDDNNAIRIIKMNEVNTALRQLADEFGMNFISNYDWFLEYTRTKGIPLQDLLDDLIHPNNEGYKVMYENIARHLGLSILQDGIIYG